MGLFKRLEKRKLINKIIEKKLDDMKLDLKGSIYGWLKDYIQEVTINTLLKQLDYLRDRHDHVAGGTYVTTEMLISPPYGRHAPILRISGRFNLTDNGYVYNPNELLNYVLGSTF